MQLFRNRVMLLLCFIPVLATAQSTHTSTEKELLATVKYASQLAAKKQYDSAHAVVLKAERIAVKDPNPDFSALVQNNKGKIFYWQGNTTRAKTIFEETLRSKTINDTSRAKAHMYMGEIYKYESDLKNAMVHYVAVEKVIRRTVPLQKLDSNYISFASLNIGSLYKRFGNKEKTLHYYQKAFAYSKDEFKSYILFDISQLYAKDTLLASALTFAHRAARLGEANNEKVYLPSYYLQLSKLHEKLNNADSTLYYAQKGLVDNTDCQLDLLYTNLGKGYAIKGQNEKAIASYLSALEESTNGQNELNVQELLVGVYTESENYKAALHHNQRYLILKDSLHKQAVEEGIAQITERYEGERKQVEIESLKKRKRLDSLLLDKRTSQIVWLMICLILAFFIIGLIFYFYRKQKRQKELLFAKNVALARELSRKRKKIIPIPGGASQRQGVRRTAWMQRKRRSCRKQ